MQHVVMLRKILVQFLDTVNHEEYDFTSTPLDGRESFKDFLIRTLLEAEEIGTELSEERQASMENARKSYLPRHITGEDHSEDIGL